MKHIENSFNEETYYNAIVGGLKNFFNNSEYELHVAIGLSGGLDSALVAKVATDAFGAHRVHGLILPSNTTSEKSVNLALSLANNLGIRTHGIPIGKISDEFVSNFEKNMEVEAHPTAVGNVMSRMRMVALMCASNVYGWAVLNTGNRTEAMLGYCTLYGDTCGAFAPIGDLYKTEVFAMSRWLNEQAKSRGEVEPIPAGIIERPPTAELVPGQTDESDIGASYEEIDDILWKIFVEGMERDEAPGYGLDPDFCNHIFAMHANTEFKMQHLPPHTIVHSELAPGEVREQMIQNEQES